MSESETKKIVILTCSELRHRFFRLFLSNATGITTLATYCEGPENNIQARVATQDDNQLRTKLLKLREQSERDFFELYTKTAIDNSRPVFILKGAINNDEHVQRIIELNPDIIISYGSSIIQEPLINAFPKKFVNIHLGLSPYYRGSGTNLWPFVNGEPEYAGVTFMHINTGIDTGEIIHQLRMRVYAGDNSVNAGNRLIVDTAHACAEIVQKFDNLEHPTQLPQRATDKYYKNKDFSEASVLQLRNNLNGGIIENYLAHKEERDAAVPIIQNSALVYRPQ